MEQECDAVGGGKIWGGCGDADAVCGGCREAEAQTLAAPQPGKAGEEPQSSAILGDIVLCGCCSGCGEAEAGCGFVCVSRQRSSAIILCAPHA